MVTTQIPQTFTPRADEITRQWWVVDAEGMVIGRMAAEIAKVLQGKHKASYVPHMDSGDFVVVVNAEKAVLTGNKSEQKVYYRHSGYPGGLKTEPYLKNPVESLRRTIKGMLPKTRLGNKMLKKLTVYADAEHPHEAQNPQVLNLNIGKSAPTKQAPKPTTSKKETEEPKEVKAEKAEKDETPKTETENEKE